MKKSNKIKYIHRGSTKKSGSAGKVGLKTFIYARDSDITANEEFLFLFPTRKQIGLYKEMKIISISLDVRL